MTPQAIAEVYQKISLANPQEAAITVLSIKDQHSQVATRVSDNMNRDMLLFDLPIGLKNLGRYTFNRYPPTPAEMENAIMLVEDEVMPLAKKLPPDSHLFLTGDALALFDTLPHPKNSYALEEIELIFRRLAEVIEGSPVVSSGLPVGNEFATLVLIVREFMHHLRFEDITLWR